MGDTENTQTAGFATLKQLQNEGKITQSQYVFYYNKYLNLTKVVKATLKSEASLLSRVNDFNEAAGEASRKLEEEQINLAEQSKALEKAREEVKVTAKEFHEVEREHDILSLSIESLQRTNGEHVKELESKKEQNASQLEPRLADLRSRVDALTRDIHKYEEQLKQGDVERKENEILIDQLHTEIEDLKAVGAKKRKQLIDIKAEPEQIKIKTEVTARKLRQLNDNLEKLRKENLEKEKELEDLRERKRMTEDDLEFVGNKLIDLREEIQQKQDDISELKKSLDQEKLKASSLIEQRLQKSSDLAASKEDLKNANHAFAQAQKNFSHLKKKYEKLRREKGNSLQIIRKLQDEKQQIDNSIVDLTAETKAMEKNLKELNRDFEVSMVQYLDDTLQQEGAREMLEQMKQRVADIQGQIKGVLDANEELQDNIEKLRAQRANLLKETNSIHIAHRAEEHRLKEKQLLVMDLKRKDELAKARLVELRSLYNTVKKSKNRFATLAANSNQAMAEMKERIKIVHNECEILKNESLSKDRALVEEARILNSAKHTRDVLRLEQLASQKNLKEFNELVRTQSMDIDKLQNIIKGIDMEMARIRSSLKVSSQKRTKTGLAVIDRNDEMCVLHEKKSILEEILQKGTKKIQELEDELRKAKVEYSHIASQTEGEEKHLPSPALQKKVEERFYELKQQIEEQNKMMKSLSDQLEQPTPSENPTRFRKVPGSDPSAVQLESKIAVLETRLQRNTEHAREKKMILQEVKMLTEKAEGQVEECGDNTLELAKKMNEYQNRIKTITRKLKSIISELSMYQATAMQLEEDLEDRNEELKEASKRLDRGDPPSEHAVNQWLRIQRDRIYKADSIKSNSDLGVEYAIQTRCEQRPTAYIDPTMGIPRPYGGKAPFKPSLLGANMRHIRKPEPSTPLE